MLFTLMTKSSDHPQAPFCAPPKADRIIELSGRLRSAQREAENGAEGGLSTGHISHGFKGLA
jgi:hypothetical protein